MTPLSSSFPKKMGGHKSFYGAIDILAFGLLVTPALGFKAMVDPLLVRFLACVQ